MLKQTPTLFKEISKDDLATEIKSTLKTITALITSTISIINLTITMSTVNEESFKIKGESSRFGDQKVKPENCHRQINQKDLLHTFIELRQSPLDKFYRSCVKPAFSTFKLSSHLSFSCEVVNKLVMLFC